MLDRLSHWPGLQVLLGMKKRGFGAGKLNGIHVRKGHLLAGSIAYSEYRLWRQGGKGRNYWTRGSPRAVGKPSMLLMPYASTPTRDTGRSRDRSRRHGASGHAHVYVWKGPCWARNTCVCYHRLQGHTYRVSWQQQHHIWIMKPTACVFSAEPKRCGPNGMHLIRFPLIRCGQTIDTGFHLSWIVSTLLAISILAR